MTALGPNLSNQLATFLPFRSYLDYNRSTPIASALLIISQSSTFPMVRLSNSISEYSLEKMRISPRKQDFEVSLLKEYDLT